MSVPDPTPDLETARAAFSAFLEDCPRAGRLVALHDSDADGVPAGVVWQRAMERLGFADAVRVLPDRARNAWTEENRARVASARPERLFVLDLGSRAEPVIADAPTCFVDHHQPEGVPPGDTLVSAYSWRPVPNTSLLMWDLCAPLVDVTDLDWVAAIGTVSDLGDRAPFPLLEDAKHRYTAKYLKEAAALVNAARRAAHYAPEVAARALLSHASPKELVLSDSDDVAHLKAARAEVKAALEEAKKAAPVFAGPVALLRLHTPCQIHPLIAQIWRTRLPKFIVMAANTGYLPGRVNFSVRAGAGVNVLDFLRAVPVEEGEGTFAHGHDQASGGSLPVGRWNSLLRHLGFPETVFAP